MKKKIAPGSKEASLENHEPLEKDHSYQKSSPPRLGIETYVTAQEAMQFLRISSPTTFLKYKKQGLIKSYKMSHSFIRYKLSDLELFMRRHRAS